MVCNLFTDLTKTEQLSFPPLIYIWFVLLGFLTIAWTSKVFSHYLSPYFSVIHFIPSQTSDPITLCMDIFFSQHVDTYCKKRWFKITVVGETEGTTSCSLGFPYLMWSAGRFRDVYEKFTLSLEFRDYDTAKLAHLKELSKENFWILQTWFSLNLTAHVLSTDKVFILHVQNEIIIINC